VTIPATVHAARERADAMGFVYSSEPGVGALLSSLAAAVPTGGRVLELGTGAGVGLAWLVHGLGDRTDVEVVTVDADDDVQARTRGDRWPGYVRFELGDGAELVRSLGTFDLIFADAPGGKTIGLEHTIAALEPGGMLVVDDMDLARHDDPTLRRGLGLVRDRLLADDRVVCSELEFSSGVILAVRRRS
jgi:demethylmenaquinone methyltransferase/2-methoxy-6-polyprenyl-1,4-benzoquinol methylase